MAKQDRPKTNEPQPPVTIETVLEAVPAEQMVNITAAMAKEADPHGDYSDVTLVNDAGETRVVVQKAGYGPVAIPFGWRVATDEELAKAKKK